MATARPPEVAVTTQNLLLGGFAIAIVVASLAPVPGTLLTRSGPLGLVAFDKWIHAASYALLAFLLSFGWRARSGRALLLVAFATVSFGAGVELLQSTVSWRTTEAADVVANAAGTVAAIGVWRVGWSYLPVRTASSTQ